MTTGAVLADGSIRVAVQTGVLGIFPFNPAHVQPASYDLTLAADICLEPKACVLAETREHFRIPITMRGELSGRSSVARLFVFVHCTGGYVDPGFGLSHDDGRSLTLEVFNASDEVRRFDAGDRICQIAFTWLDRPAEQPYRGRYADQDGPTASLFRHGDE